MKTITPAVGKVLYAILFLIVLPALLIGWALLAEKNVILPALEQPLAGILFSAGGALLMTWGMLNLIIHGKGLPMNAYPPEKYVRKGIYRYISHPIYVGFSILVIGISVIGGSSAGLWLVSPMVIMGCVALVLGYERLDLAARFPGEHFRARFSPPEPDSRGPRWYQRFAVCLQLFIPWWVLNAVVLYLIPIPDSWWDASLPSEITLISKAGAVTGLFLLLLTPLLAKTKGQLYELSLRSWLGGGLAIALALLWPELGAGYQWGMDMNELLPWFAFHPVWILIAAPLYKRIFPRLGYWVWTLFIFLALTTMLQSYRPLYTFGSTALIIPLALKPALLWKLLLSFTENIANSWKEWMIGPIRVINHGFYVGASAFLGLLLIGWLTGQAYVWPVVIFALLVIFTSGLWAQLIEGSEKLKRPFGYYGGLAGILFGSIAVWLMGYNVWVVIAAFSVAMPFVQAIGRLRCLINGCCHGSPAPPDAGIRYFHPRSRVCGISDLRGVALYPTPLYSILWLVLTGFVLLRLWFAGAAFPFLFGLYLLLTSFGRFVEEAYRGEVQTPVIRGLRLYQWTAVAGAFLGIVFTILPPVRPALNPEFGWEIIAAALLLGGITTFAMGVDFPRSDRRFSRLV